MIVYYKLANLLKERNMTWKDLRDCGLAVNTPTQLSKNRNVNTDTIDKVCKFLKVQPGDIMEWVSDESVLREKEILAQMEALKKELEQIRK